MSLSQLFANSLTHKRVQQRLTIAEVSDMSRVDAGRISEIESGLRFDMKLSTLERLATALGCRVDVRLIDVATGRPVE